MTSWLLGNPGNGNATPNLPATALRVQSSVQGQPRAIGYGQARVSGNLLDYIDFVAVPHQQSGSAGKGSVGSGGGKGGNGSTSYTYQVAVAISICEGPITTVLQVWNNTTPQTLSSLNLTFFTGAYDQQPWGYWASPHSIIDPTDPILGLLPILPTHPDHALNYRGLAYVAAGPIQLGSSPELPNLNYEVQFAVSYAIPDQPDASPRDVVIDYLTNAFYGVGFPSSRIGDSELDTYHRYCVAAGLLVSPVETQQRPASDFLTSLLQGTNSGAVWSGGQLKIVPYGDQTITQGDQQTLSETHAIPHGFYLDPAESWVHAGNPGTFVSDGGVIYANSGVPLTFVANTNPQPTVPVGHYRIQQGYYIFNSGEVGTLITLTYTFAAAATYNAPDAPIYDLDDDDFQPTPGGNSGVNGPIEVSRKRRADAYNDIKVEYLDRADDYNPAIVEVKDDASIQTFTLRAKGTNSLHYFALAASAQLSAMLQLGRENVLRTFSFTLGAQYILLDPMDIVSITDSYLGLERQWVRITDIQENADLTLTITAEEYLQGTGHAPLYGKTVNTGPALNYNIPPGDVNPPIIFEPTIDLSGGMEIWIAVSGADVAAWGGCDLYVSYDNVTYAKVPGSQLGPARMGLLTALLPTSGSNPDTTNVLAVDLTESGSQLASGSHADADALNTICYVDGEIIAYATATPTALDQYNLSYLVRGAYNTPVGAHNSGTQFARLDSGIFVLGYDQTRIGATIYIKFASFNIYGGAKQSLADIEPYTYTIKGLGNGTTTLSSFAATGVTVTGASGAKIPGIQVTWTPITNKAITSVVVEFYVDGDLPSHSTQVTFSNPAAGIGLITTGIQAGTTYHVRATITTAPNNILPSAWTAYVTVTTPSTLVLPTGQPADVPSGLSLVNVLKVQSDGSIVAGIAASWSDDSGNAIFSYYDAEISTDGGVTYLGTNIGVPRYEWDNLVVGSTVRVKVRTVSRLGALSAFCTPVAIVVTGQSSAPFAPTGLTAKAAFQTVFLSWTNPVNPDLAYIEIFQGATNSQAVSTLIATTSGSSFAVSGLNSDQQYFYWVRAVNTSGLKGPFNAPNASGTAVTTLQVGTTDVEPNAITTPLLAAGSVLTDQLGAGVITAGKMAAASITAGNAALDVLTVGTGNIKHLAVDTLQIAGNAVTVPSFSQRNDLVAGNNGGQDVLDGSLTVTGVAGDTIFVQVSTIFNLAQSATTGALPETFLFVNGVQVVTTTYGQAQTASGIQSSAAMAWTIAITATGGPQTVTAFLDFAGPPAVQIGSRQMTMLAVKR